MSDKDHGKTQQIRLIDVFLLGPYLVWLASRPGTMTKGHRLILTGIGLATIVYNWTNYSRIGSAE